MKSLPFAEIDHVQLAMPSDGEAAARNFYVGVLGMLEIAKPARLAQRGGAWFASGKVQIHLGVEANFRAARKAHPALKCSDYEGLLKKIRTAGVAIQEDDSIPGVQRCHVYDPFGNRIELIAA